MIIRYFGDASQQNARQMWYHKCMKEVKISASLLDRGITDLIPRDELEKQLKSGKKLRLKFGVDVTSPDLHIGHAVVLRKLREFQDLGHIIVLVVGDYTTKIGDPSGKSKTRPMLDDKEIAANVKTYLDQVGIILDVKKVEIRYNSEWLGKLDFSDLIKLASNISVAQLIERDDFSKRLAAGSEIALHEFMYPLMVAYDSVALEADVEFGGTDQLFNLLAGRNLQKKLGQKPQCVVTVPLLVGLDGVHKMSKSLGNYVALTDAPADMFGKVMSVSDNLIGPYFELCTNVPQEEIDAVVGNIAQGANPRDTKASLAREIVRIYHGEEAAEAAEQAFNDQFRDKKQPTDIPLHTAKKGTDFADVLIEANLVTSKSEIRRLVMQAGIKHNNQVVTPEFDLTLKDGDIIQVGKRRFIKLRVR
jgi:tyrosyl-tRNA synthetase